MSVGAMEPRRLAQRIGLRYVNDQEEGFSRRRCGRGFRYLHADGRPMRRPADLQRIEALAIPPAWNEVWICADPRGHIQATGRDDRQRKQYIYHEQWQQASNQCKFSGLIEFADELPLVRRTVRRQLDEPASDRERLLALLVRILDLTGMRVGNEEYAEENDHYGLTTLRKRHVRLSGCGLEFRFTGKSGQRQDITVTDPTVVRLVRKWYRRPGRLLFQFAGPQGCTPVSSTDVNEYLHAVTGNGTTAKDFRTWKGTVLAADLLVERGPVNSARQRLHTISDVVCNVAGQLGNTPAVCRNYYIHPGIIDSYLEGRFQQLCESFHQRRQKWLSKPEQFVRHLLEKL